jgi:hypothetical protein
MKTIMLVLGGLFLLLVIAVYVGVMFFLGSVVKAGVNNYGPKLTQTSVVLTGATLSPFSGSGTLTGLTVGNPRGWSAGNAFSVGAVHLDLEPMSVFRDVVVINEITIDQPEFLYETKIVSSNIKDLLENIEDFTGPGDPGRSGEKNAKAKKFIVKKFRVTNAKATVGVGPTALPVDLTPVRLDNIGVAEGGITGEQLAGVLVRNVLGSVVAGTANTLAQPNAAATIEKTKEAAKQAGEALKKLIRK